MARLLSILLSFALLTGCVETAFLASATAGSFILNDRRTIRTIADDHKITYQADKRIRADYSLHQQSHIVISSFNKNILLVGQTPTPELRDKALRAVSGVPKVKRIYNEITISGPTSSLTRTSDSWLTTKVKTNMITTKGLDSLHVKVVTENGTVYLMGLVSQYQGSLAAKVASKTGGVERVVKLFTYIK